MKLEFAKRRFLKGKLFCNSVGCFSIFEKCLIATQNIIKRRKCKELFTKTHRRTSKWMKE